MVEVSTIAGRRRLFGLLPKVRQRIQLGFVLNNRGYTDLIAAACRAPRALRANELTSEK